MTADARRARSIFLKAVEERRPDQWRAYLDETCGGDAALRERVEVLLQAHAMRNSLLDAPAGLVATLDRPIAEQPGEMIGPYKLLEQIGEGGFGVVFMAEQQQPVRRKVALKVLKPGMDTRQVVARFEAERQALALMDHPNIAHVFDGGATATGRPYFVMELVRGIPITDFCDESSLPIRQRLELFVDVCEAVKHAHQKGIIHRDIKPTNVMVTLHDGTPVVKVIDFGVAKAMGQQLTEKTLFTNFSQMVGTPLYMSPEQAEMSALDVDTRSDIYSLGVLLYELLTGTTPFENERLSKVGYDEMRRIVREEEPPKPSTRMSTVGKAAATASERRQGDPRKLSRLFRGELDWIVMKALEKDRNLRYETATSFALDIERYLRDEQVVACPPTAGYRLRKLLRRHRGPAAAIGAVLAVLMGGIVTTSVGFLSARSSQRRAEQNFEIAKNAVDDYLNKVTEDPALKRSDFNALRKKLLESAVPFYQRLIERKPGDAAQEAARGLAYGRLGDLRRQMGETTAALADYERMRSIFAQLAAEFAAEPTYRDRLAESHANLAAVLQQLGRHDEAESACRSALALQERLAADLPTVRGYRENLAATCNKLGSLLTARGKRDEAEAAYRDALAIYEMLAADPTIPEERDAAARHSLGLLLDDLGNRAEAEAAYRASAAIQGKLVADYPAVTEYRENLATTRNRLGLLLTAMEKYDEAEAAFREALAIWEMLTVDFTTMPEYRRNLATTRNKLGLLLTAVGRCDEAEAAFRAALPIYEKLAADFPIVPEYRYLWALTLNNLGVLLDKTGKRNQTEAAYRDALAIYEKLAVEFPTVLEYSEHRARTYHSLGLLSIGLGKRDEAEADFSAALAIWEKLPADFPSAPEYSQRLVQNCQELGQLHARKGQWPEAAASFMRAIELDSEDHQSAYQLSFVLAEQGDLSAYQNYCDSILSRWGKDTDPMRAAGTLKACLLLAGGVPDPEQLAPLAQTALSVSKKREAYSWVLFAKGLHDYRCGRFAQARAACAESREQATSEFAGLRVIDQTVEAMSSYRLGTTDEARQVLAAARRLLDQAQPKPDGDDLGTLWHDWICCRILLREADELLKIGRRETNPARFSH